MAQKSLKSRRQTWLGLAFISPWLLGFIVFTLYPFLSSIYLSFTRYDVVSPPQWIGAANYTTLVQDDPLFWKSISITLTYAVVSIPLGVATGVALAMLLNSNIKGIAVYRTIFYLPSVVPAAASSVVFMWILNPQIGLVNGILKGVRVVGPAWLNDAKWSLWSLIFMGLWGVGGSMVIYLAGLKDIPIHLYEAATLDGAGPFQKMRRITLPMLTPVIFFNLIMSTIGAFQYFTPAFIMTGGGPEDSTMFYALYLFNRAWKFLDMGYASAMAWVLFVVVVTLTSIMFRSQKRWVHYDV